MFQVINSQYRIEKPHKHFLSVAHWSSETSIFPSLFAYLLIIQISAQNTYSGEERQVMRPTPSLPFSIPFSCVTVSIELISSKLVLFICLRISFLSSPLECKFHEGRDF